jgi:hypothetical protein
MATAKKMGEVSWQNVQAKGDAPSPRSGHSITVAGSKAVIFGGCGVSEDGLTQQVFSETWLLELGETPKWELADMLGDVPVARWRHTSTLLPDGKDMLIFGGLCQGKRFNDTYVLSIDKMEWNIKECAGTPPHPRSHHTSNLIEFEAETEEEITKHKVIAAPATPHPFAAAAHLPPARARARRDATPRRAATRRRTAHLAPTACPTRLTAALPPHPAIPFSPPATDLRPRRLRRAGHVA